MLFFIVLVFWGPSLLTADQNWPLYSLPRKTVPLSSIGGSVFQEDGVWNYTIMLLKEDMGVLILGAQQTIFALDLTNITQKKAMVKWQVPQDMQRKCSEKGKNLKLECQNYIRILHEMPDGRMFVCGTYAFSPTCDYMLYKDGKLTLENKTEDGKGKCPFDPVQRYTSELVEKDLYSATAMNFMGSDMVLMRSSTEMIRTEFKPSWLKEPTFVGMKHVPEGEGNSEGDDDKIYLFFTETAVEFDSYTKVEVSRVAHVCKGDVGGLRTLQKKWTSFVKARLECPVPQSRLPFLIQDVFLFCPGNWTSCVFYGVFTPQGDSSQYSAVCAYTIQEIRKVFSKGKFKAPVTVGTAEKWVTYTDSLPFPRPGACINNEARQRGFKKSSDLPDKTLQFIKDKPLMDQAVRPMSYRPLLVKKGAAFTRIVVANTTALNRKSHQVMFIGTESGSVLKAVNYDGETIITDEVQLFKLSEPVKTLRLSTTGQLYIGSEVAAVQMPLSFCGQYRSCVDCVLARDPYCGWDLTANKCTDISNISSDTHSEVIQNLSGDATRCPAAESPKPTNISFHLGSTIRLMCQPDLVQVQWHVDERLIENSETYHIQPNSLLILNASADAAGHYTCSSVESFRGRRYVIQHAMYDLTVDAGETLLLSQEQSQQQTFLALQVMVVLLALMLFGLVMWNCYKGHCNLLGFSKRAQNTEEGQETLKTEYASVSVPEKA
ncbi:semaphorin-4E [Trichomycterus rosablanca]|uniref:semaphorin-4E n=1 Tax=Trichomycterus rosablanca TaxID=2290929 RepID=UPI002F361245